MKPPIFEAENLRVERDAVILRNISWRVERGQHWVILGANGSGKTSLLSALTGYLIPTRGEMRIGGSVFGATDWRDVRSAIGLVSSSLAHNIEPDQIAREIVLSGRDGQINFWRRVTRAEARLAATHLRHVHASHLADRPWCYLSQGERQRILIGRALISRPQMLFLDEPCAGLDPVAREDFLGFLEKLARQPHAPTLVLVTHHVEEIVRAFTHVLLLHRGTVLAAGPKEKILTSKLLGQTFNGQLKLRQTAGRYSLHVSRTARSFVS
jgi:iron complex transport system ATP-binding protein